MKRFVISAVVLVVFLSSSQGGFLDGLPSLGKAIGGSPDEYHLFFTATLSSSYCNNGHTHIIELCSDCYQ